ncbi:hypothetical protein [Geodermatophilus sp. URMC 65]
MEINRPLHVVRRSAQMARFKAADQLRASRVTAPASCAWPASGRRCLPRVVRVMDR